MDDFLFLNSPMSRNGFPVGLRVLRKLERHGRTGDRCIGFEVLRTVVLMVVVGKVSARPASL